MSYRRAMRWKRRPRRVRLRTFDPFFKLSWAPRPRMGASSDPTAICLRSRCFVDMSSSGEMMCDEQLKMERGICRLDRSTETLPHFSSTSRLLRFACVRRLAIGRIESSGWIASVVECMKRENEGSKSRPIVLGVRCDASRVRLALDAWDWLTRPV